MQVHQREPRFAFKYFKSSKQVLSLPALQTSVNKVCFIQIQKGDSVTCEHLVQCGYFRKAHIIAAKRHEHSRTHRD